MRSRMPVLSSNYRRCSPTSFLRRGQCTHPPNSNWPTALPLQNKGGLHESVCMPPPPPLLKANANQLDTAVEPKGPNCGEEPQTAETLTAAVWKRYSTEIATIRRTIPTALGSYHQPGQRASACCENPSLRALGTMFQQQQQHQQQQRQQRMDGSSVMRPNWRRSGVTPD